MSKEELLKNGKVVEGAFGAFLKIFLSDAQLPPVAVELFRKTFFAGAEFSFVLVMSILDNEGTGTSDDELTDEELSMLQSLADEVASWRDGSTLN